jgi:hypothetical protein
MAKVSASFRRDGHFADDEWLDFARGQDAAEQRSRLGAHLQSGCKPCDKALRFWQTVFGLARQDVAYEPPDAVIRQLEGQFALQRPKGALARATLRASLVFDSFKVPLAAGVRSTGPIPRQLFYKAGRYAIRLRTDPVPDSDRLMIVGQVVDEENPDHTLSDLAVLIFTGKEIVDRTLTNRLGEFTFEGAPTKDLRLAVGIRTAGFLTVAMPESRKKKRLDEPLRRSRLNWK